MSIAEIGLAVLELALFKDKAKSIIIQQASRSLTTCPPHRKINKLPLAT